MKKMIFAWIFLAFGLLGTLYFMGTSYQKEYKDYMTLEEDMNEAASMYMDMNDIKLSIGSTKVIASKMLLSNNFISSMKVKDDSCTGYVIAKKKIGDIMYDSYIKCKKYTTPDYDKDKNNVN